MDDTEKAFLARIEQDEDDYTTRGAFADWLDEHDRPEEADAQRNFQASKKWLLDFLAEHNDHGYEDENEVTYEQLVLLGRVGVLERGEDGDFGFSLGRRETVCQALRENKEEFWKHWSVVTGIQLPGPADESHFRCGC